MFVIRDGKKIAKRGNPGTLFRRHLDVGMLLTSPPNGPELCRAGTFFLMGSFVFRPPLNKERRMNGLIYLIGLIVLILAVLSFFGLR